MTTHSVNNYVLSVLIPTYEYREGLLRILSQLQKSSLLQKFQVIISDNSSRPLLSDDEVNFYIANESLNLMYVHRSSNSARENWNFLINHPSNNSDYSLLFHHDEIFESHDAFDRLLVLLEDNNCFRSCYFLDHQLMGSILSKTYHFNFPLSLRAAIFSNFPELLLYFNFLGPPSAFVFHRDFLFLYDLNLSFLVDIHMYIRISRSAFFSFVPIRTFTVPFAATITSSLKSRKFYRLFIRELLYVANNLSLSPLSVVLALLFYPFCLFLKYCVLIFVYLSFLLSRFTPFRASSD